MTTYATIGEMLQSPPRKQKCDRKGCQSMAYWNGSYFACVVCDHEQFDPCMGDCGQLKGWCNCNGEREPPLPIEEAKSVMRRILELLAEEQPRRTRDFYAAMADRSKFHIDKCLKELWDEELICKPAFGFWRLP